MNVVTKIGLKGIGPFLKPTVFKIPSGITYLYGKNMLAGGNPNASGKSTLVSSLAELFYDEPIVGTRQDKNKSGSRFVEFQRGKHSFKVASEKNKIKISVNGEDRSGRTNANTKEVLQKSWPLTSTDFTTYVYLDSVVPHPLARGTTAERKAFFNEFFGLDRLDAQKKVIQAELLKLRKSKAAYVELKATYDQFSQDLLDEDKLTKLKAKIKKAKSTVDQLREAAEQYQEMSRLIEFKRLAKEHLDKIKCAPEDIREELNKAKRILAKAEEYEEQLQEYRGYLKARERYEQLTKGLDLKTPIEELKRAHRDYSSNVADLEEANDPPKEVKKPKVLDIEEKPLTVLQAQLEHSIEHAKKFKTGVCPTCGQEVKAEPLEVLRKKLRKVQDQLDEVEEFKEQSDKYKRYKELYVEWEKEEEERIRKQAAQPKLKKLAELYEQRIKLQKPEKVEKPEAVKGLVEAKQVINSLEFLAPHVDLIPKLNQIQNVEFDPSDLNIAQDELSNLTTKYEIHKSVEARVKDLKDRLTELKKDVKNEEALKVLLDGYSDKAVKKMVIDAISTHLMTTINQYSQMVFSGYKFEFVWRPQVQILVNRPKLGTTDVRKLSGAESKLFTIILVLALMKFVPRKKRVNVLIMDEPTASFSEETTKLFHRILPQLNQVVPSIVVVTPKAKERYEGASEYTVVRDADGSYLKKGHPSEI